MIPLSPSISPVPIFLQTLQELQQFGLCRATTAQRSYNHLAILKHHKINKHKNNNNDRVSTTHTQEKCISLPHSNRSGILCQNFVSNSPGFQFSTIWWPHLMWNCTKSQNNSLFTLNLHRAMAVPFFSLSTLCKPAHTDIPAFPIWYHSIQSISDPWLDIHTVSYFFCSSLVDQLYAKGVYLCNFVTKSYKACTKHAQTCTHEFL